MRRPVKVFADVAQQVELADVVLHAIQGTVTGAAHRIAQVVRHALRQTIRFAPFGHP